MFGIKMIVNSHSDKKIGRNFGAKAIIKDFVFPVAEEKGIFHMFIFPCLGTSAEIPSVLYYSGPFSEELGAIL